MFRNRSVIKFFGDWLNFKKGFFGREFFKNYTWGGTFSERNENDCAW